MLRAISTAYLSVIRVNCALNTSGLLRIANKIASCKLKCAFALFDLEVAFLFPWAVTLSETGAFGFWSMLIFLGILTVGFIYEWRKGALEWE